MEVVPTAWTKLEHQGERPTKRSGHTLCSSGSQSFLFGGIDNSSPPGPTNHLYIGSVGDDSIEWTRPQVAGEPPAPRWKHTTVALSGERRLIILFGGFATSTTRLNDTWLLDTETLEWSQPDAVLASSRQPIRRDPDDDDDDDDAQALNVHKREYVGELGAGGDAAAAGIAPVDTSEHAPTPRGAHSATLVGDDMWVFGGYGGSGFARQDFNDLFRFNTAAMSWEEIGAVNGEPPAPRSGHAAMASKDKIVVYGGWNSGERFGDVWTFDTSTLTWTSLPKARIRGSARWNLSAVTVEAVPHWQLFLFGGSLGKVEEDEEEEEAKPAAAAADTGAAAGGGLRRRRGRKAAAAALETKDESDSEDEDGKEETKEGFQNDVLLLDSGCMELQPLPTEGKPPRARADMGLMYEAERKRLIVMGGWCNRWLGDAHALNVTMQVGPPYAVTGISPKMGPITGGTPMRVEGMGFTPGEYMTVRFISGKKFQDTSGQVNEEGDAIELDSPSFDTIGVGQCEVRVTASDSILTITKQAFTVFHVTDANKSVAYGPALVPGGVAERETSFMLAARDTADRNRFTGGDEWEVVVARLPDEEPEEDGAAKKKKKKAAGKGGSDEKLPAGEPVEGVELEDHENGRYTVRFTPPSPGKYRVDVAFKGTFDGVAGALRGTPLVTEFAAATPETAADANLITGERFTNWLGQHIAAMQTSAKHTLSGLRQEVPAEQLDTLIGVMNHVKHVNNEGDTVKLNSDIAHSAIATLREQEAPKLQREAKRMATTLGEADGTWSDCQRQAPMTRIAIAPKVKRSSASTRHDIEKFEHEMKEYYKTTFRSDYWKFDTGFAGGKEGVAEQRQRHLAMKARTDRMLHLARTFDFPQYLDECLRIMAMVEDETEQADQLWDGVQEVDTFMQGAKEGLWRELKADDLEDAAKTIHKQVKRIVNKETRLRDVFRGLDKQIKSFLATCPLLADLGHPSMQPRHWQMLMDATGKEFTPPHEDPEMKVANVLELNLSEFEEQVEEIIDRAGKEQKLEQGLATLTEAWATIQWVSERFNGVPLLNIGEEDFETLEAHQLLVQGMCANRYMETFKDDILGWRGALNNVSDVRSILGEIQQLWKYLEPLFMHSEEVKRELHDDAERFAGADATVRELLAEAHETQNVREACNRDGLLKQLEGLLKLLEQCKKALDEYLAGKRAIFPRFYFVSDPDLLDILSNGNYPKRVMQHITKIFLATDSFELDGGTDEDPNDRPTAVRWHSCVGKEDVEFNPHFKLEGKVEAYLQVALEMQRSSMRQLMLQSVERYPTKPRPEWLMDKRPDGPAQDPSAVSLLVAGMDYVSKVEKAFDEMAAGNAEAMPKAQEGFVEELGNLIRLTRTKGLDKANRKRIMCMITLDAHGRDIVHKMIHLNVTDKSSFHWQSMLKQRLKDGDAVLTILDASFPYRFEYLGNGARLVITPLTDRIYVTATQALKLSMGCAPAGPAGTGKTETTKDLASSLGIVCYVFNCSPEHDYKALGNIFKGLAASGSWGCFDEFNRLVPSVLSVCSVQFKAVCDGIRERGDQVTINGETVHLEHSAGAFITMNPGYLGRSELPEGLKSLFRPITVMVPDLVLICENMLMAEGFEEAKVLASKFYGLYSLLRELLSKQLHYDWGLRAVKSVLVVAGSFKRMEPDLPEQELLMRALRDFNTPKIVKQDEAIFHGLLGDLFPNMNPPRKVDHSLEEAVVKAAVQTGLDDDDTFCLKVVQLDELLEIRHCVFVMGPPGCGKSQCWRTLSVARTLKEDKPSKTKFVDINPKAVIPEELYGFSHPATREWKDGVLSVVMRDLGKEPDTNPKWIILDGDLDANWIESMNSVMDDNKMLTLASNERIPLKPHMRMIFEIRDLVYASPATVSRAGILYISTAEGRQWRSLIKSWLARLQASDEFKAALEPLFGEEKGYCKATLTHIAKDTKPSVRVEDTTLVGNLLRFLDCLLTPERIAELSKPEHAEDLPRILETYFCFAAIWGFGSALSVKDGEDYRDIFGKFFRSTFRVRPPREAVFDYWLNPDGLEFVEWRKSPYFTSVEYDSKVTPMSHVTVPTPETVSINFWMKLLLAKQIPIMLVGDAGCGKTQLIEGLLRGGELGEMTSQTINFNFYTDARTLQTNLEAPLEKKTSTTFGPPGQGKLVYFLDDLNLPEVDPYDTQSAIALVRQHFDYGHWYDLNKLQARNIVDCQYVAALNPTAGSFAINPRLQRQFVTFAMGFPGPNSLRIIYNTFLSGHLQHFDEGLQEVQGSILAAAMSLHMSVMGKFRKSAQNFHYEFNIRHLSNVFQGLLVMQPEQLDTPSQLAVLWLHESERVYGDRLVSKADLSEYKKLAQAQAKKSLGQYFNDLQGFFADNPDPLVFCHFAESIQEKVYDRVTSMEKLHTTLVDALREYNESFATMNLVLFEDAMRHVCRITRIINNPAGHALLVGVGGSGKQSLSRLSSFICGYTVKQIVISSTYSLNDFRDDLKGMYKTAGVKDEGVVFLFTDSQITNERFLVSMNDLLASGNIPDLFPQDEVDEIVNAVTTRAKSAGVAVDAVSVWGFFLQEVRRNLHVILCFSPMGEDFRTRAKRFPALVNCTVIDWFQPWPEEALFSVGRNFLESVDLGEDSTRHAIEKFMPYSFQTVNKAAARFFQSDRRYVYTTPKSYLELLALYKKLLGDKRADSTAAITRLSDGLAKLRETADKVEQIEAHLKVSLAEAEEKRATAEGIAAEVRANKQVVEEETEKANAAAAEAAVVAKEASRAQTTAQTELDAAEPKVRQAEAALDTVKEKDLSMAKTMSRPPAGVDDVFTAVQILLANVPGTGLNIVTDKAGRVKKADRTWDAAKKQMMTKIPVFMQAVMAFKSHVDDFTVPDVNYKEVRYLIELEHFNGETMQTKNPAAAGLCEWARNIVEYRDILVRVDPLRQTAKEAGERLEEANAHVAMLNEKVAGLQAKLDELETALAAATAQKQAAEAAVAQGQSKLDLANRLTNALAEENVRWAQNVDALHAAQELIVGDALLASAFISYVGPFTKQYRQTMVMQDWVPFLRTAANGESIPMSDNPNPLELLTDEAQVATWLSCALPDDTVSKENGAIITNTARWPLMIDPQLQGIKWVTNMEEKLHVVRQTQKTMLPTLEQAIQQGEPVLIENLEERIEAVLNPVIQRAVSRRGGRVSLKLGDKEIDYHPNFKLYLHTKLSNPHYPPEVQAETALVNFTVTEEGLEDQLLAMTVQKERPDLAELRSALIDQQNKFKIKMKQLEDNILSKLAAAEGDLTEDVELIEGLEATKKVANSIKEKQAVAIKTEKQINTTAEKYRPVARRAALLFFIMNGLFKVHTYYIYSLASFVAVFLRSIDLVSGDLDPYKDEWYGEQGGPGGDAIADDPAAAAEGAGEPAAEPAADAEAGAEEAEPAAADAAAAAEEEEEEEEEGGGEAASGEGTPAADGGEGGDESKDEEEEGGGAAEPAAEIREGLSDEQLVVRCDVLKESTTSVSFQFITRGLFDKDKLTIATQMCLKILVDEGLLDAELVRLLVMGEASKDPGQRGPLSEWLPPPIWAKVKALERVKPVFEKLGDDMQNESDRWRAWFDHEKPEAQAAPGDYRRLPAFHRLLLLRAMRPDRLVSALTQFVSDNLGEQYVKQMPFDMASTYAESTSAVPIFFVLFPGVDPTVWVEALGHKLDFTSANNKFVNISMGQGQEENAAAQMARLQESGGWLFLQNVHLMQEWLPWLERQLELAADTAHEDFRCFVSAEPPPLSYFKNMPESFMQSAIKVANEAPADLRSNLVRAWANFSEETIEASQLQTEFKACLLTLCFYHAIVLGRRRFGQQGWSKRYSFNTGDLTVCADVLQSYINNAGIVPWEDLRYVIGQIMYGGHITDSWDRRTNNTYLEVFLEPGIMSQMELAPGFKVPDTATMSYADITKYIDEALPKESPPLYGLHPNAEIGYLTSYGDDIFGTILSLDGGGGGGGGDEDGAAAGGPAAAARSTLEDLLERLPDEFFMPEIMERAEPMLGDQTAPYVLVAMQECTRMNALVGEIRRSLVELQKGMDGQLNMSEPMEHLLEALSINQVPGRNPFHKTSWENKAWPSRKSLQAWFRDLLARVAQLRRWASDLICPKSLWLPGLFNPMAFLTAIMQVTARQTNLPLDNMAIETHLTTMMDPEEADNYPEDGMFVHGLFIEGARWPKPDDDEGGEVEVIGGVSCRGHIIDSRLKELLPALPLMYLRAVPVQPTWMPESVGYMRNDDAVYECPVYTTTFRGPTYVFLATLRTVDPKSKWVRAGVAIIMSTDEST